MGVDDQFTLEMISATELAGKVLAIGTTEKGRKAALAQSLGLDKAPVYVNFLVLAPPTDLTAVLLENKKLAEAVGQIFISDGCKNCQDLQPPAPLSLNNVLWQLAKKQTITRTYNVSMDALATVYLFEMASNGEVNVLLVSSSLLAEKFGDGVEFGKKFPKLKLISKKNTLGFKINVEREEEFQQKAHIVEQFSAAGPIAVLAIMDMTRGKLDGMPESDNFVLFTIRSKKVSLITLKSGEEKPEHAEYQVELGIKQAIKIRLLANFNVDTFGNAMTLILEKINKQCNYKNLSEKPKEKKNIDPKDEKNAASSSSGPIEKENSENEEAKKNLVIISDMGAEDQFTLDMISATELVGKVLAIGTTEKARKAALAQSLGLDKAPVY
ncbi:hypothetical protein niasHT_029798 [Heterodera trifolii]|uniref:Uncharacterized protein n=1 Tax=Heterodera trifolii TaxID=157864 RepID=A0ABD2K3N7_9BILA